MTNRKALPSADDSRTLLPVRPRSDQAACERPDLILVDLLVPSVLPLAACRVLQSPEDTRAIPVSLLTTGASRAAGSSRAVGGCCRVGPVWTLVPHARRGGGNHRSET